MPSGRVTVVMSLGAMPRSLERSAGLAGFQVSRQASLQANFIGQALSLLKR